MFLFNLRSKFGQDPKFFLFDILFLCAEDARCGDGEIALQYIASSSGRRFGDSNLLPDKSLSTVLGQIRRSSVCFFSLSRC